MLPKEKLIWGLPCRKHNHQKADGTNLRHIVGGCMSCNKEHLGITDQDELLIYLTTPHYKRTPEEVAAGYVRASMRWNAKNKEKTKEYIKKYNSKEEVKERYNLASKERYAAKTVAEKEALAEIQSQRYLERKAAGTHRPSEAKRLRRRELQNERYSKLSPEDKSELYRVARARLLAKRLKETPDDGS